MTERYATQRLREIAAEHARARAKSGRPEFDIAPVRARRVTGDESARRYAARLRRQFSATLEDYNGWLEAQGHRCAICGAGILPAYNTTHTTEVRMGPRPGSARIDVDPVTDRIRGLLCNPCDLGLGLFQDSPTNLQRAAAYLQAAAQRSK